MLALLAPTTPWVAAASTIADTHRSAAGPVVARADAPGTRYVYNGSFSAEMTHKLFVDWGAPDSESISLSATVSGSLLVDGTKYGGSGDSISSRVSNGSVKVTEGNALGITTTNSGNSVQTCRSDSGQVLGPPIITTSSTLTDVLYPFVNLSLPATCTSTEDETPSKKTFQYGSLALDLDVGSQLGSSSITLGFGGSYSLDKEPQLCPGYVAGQTSTCKWEITGILKLNLVKKIEPPKTPPEATPKPPKGGNVTPGAKKAKIPVLCRKKCKIRIELTPLKGGPRLIVPKTVSPPAGKITTFALAIPADKRTLVKRSGGIRVKLTYRLAGGIKYSESRRVRL